jgi:hypothetical protein
VPLLPPGQVAAGDHGRGVWDEDVVAHIAVEHTEAERRESRDERKHIIGCKLKQKRTVPAKLPPAPLPRYPTMPPTPSPSPFSLYPPILSSACILNSFSTSVVDIRRDTVRGVLPQARGILLREGNALGLARQRILYSIKSLQTCFPDNCHCISPWKVGAAYGRACAAPPCS